MSNDKKEQFSCNPFVEMPEEVHEEEQLTVSYFSIRREPSVRGNG